LSAFLRAIEEFPNQVRQALQRHPIQQPAKIDGRTRAISAENRRFRP
jgi:hypothetical protein